MRQAGMDGKTRVLQAVDLVELIGQSVKLTRRGKDYVGLCPFHQEKTPSFHVSPAKQFFHCYGCKAGGNAIDFMMRRDRLPFLDALRSLAGHYNIELPQFSEGKREVGEKQALLEAHSAACALFEKLLQSPTGEAARAYLAQRGFDEPTLRRFQVGFVPEGWDTLLKSAEMRKYAPALLASGGLIKPRAGGSGFYDTFRNRLMFPIRDETGRIIAFGGRVMPGSPDPAKYLNSPETPLFSKSRCAFGLDLARQKIVETRTVAVVEGYTDVIMAHQFGVANVVSILGTAMTEPHVALLRRFADRIVLLFDADAAGENAVNRAVELFLTQPVEIAIASIPEALDPDEYLIKHGAEAFGALIQQAQDAMTFAWKRLGRQINARGDLTSQQEAVDQYLNLLASARGSGPVDDLRWGAVLSRVSRLTEIPVNQLHRRFQTGARPARAIRPAAPPPSPARSGASSAERWILGVLLAEPQRWKEVQHEVQVSDFTDPLHRRLAEAYWNHQRDEGEPAFNEFLSVLAEIRPDMNESNADPSAPPAEANAPGALVDLAVELYRGIEHFQELDRTLADALLEINRRRQEQERRKLMAALRRTNAQAPNEAGSADSNRPEPVQRETEVELLRRLSEQARRPDVRRMEF